MKALFTVRRGTTAHELEDDGFVMIDCRADGDDALRVVRREDGRMTIVLPRPGGAIYITERQAEHLDGMLRAPARVTM